MTKADSLATKKILTAAHEDYLKAIYTLNAGGIEVSNSALANYLEVSPASATNMVKKLAELDLVTYTPYQSATLTTTGERIALEVLRHHRLIELYLHEKLKLPWDQVHAEAERLEHVISEVLEDAMAAALNDPTIDPHGDPIPSKDGRIEKVEGAPLSIAELNHPYRIVRVLAQDPERLSYLGALGLYPNAAVTLLKRAPFSGPLLIDVAGEHHALAHDMAESLLVALDEPVVEEGDDANS
jgi:DtxR family transcriptional regulator, Mn-dependent transcriptional regulator